MAVVFTTFDEKSRVGGVHRTKDDKNRPQSLSALISDPGFINNPDFLN